MGNNCKFVSHKHKAYDSITKYIETLDILSKCSAFTKNNINLLEKEMLYVYLTRVYIITLTYLSNNSDFWHDYSKITEIISRIFRFNLNEYNKQTNIPAKTDNLWNKFIHFSSISSDFNLLNEIKYELIWEQFTKCIVCGQSKKSCCQNKMLEKENIWYIDFSWEFDFNLITLKFLEFSMRINTPTSSNRKNWIFIRIGCRPLIMNHFCDKMNEIKRIHKSKAFITIVIHILLENSMWIMTSVWCWLYL